MRSRAPPVADAARRSTRSGRKNRASEQREDFFGHRKAVGANTPWLPLERICAQYGFRFFDREKSKSVASTAKRQRGLQRGKLGSPLPCFASFCRSKRKAPAASGANYAFVKGSVTPTGDHKLSPAGQAHSLGLCKRPRPAGRRNENMPRQKDRKKLLPQRDRSFICGGKWGASDGSLYFAGTQAAGAGVDTAGSTVYNCLYSSDIGLPGTVRTAMGVRNLDTESDALTTNFAFCHLSAPPYRAI